MEIWKPVKGYEGFYEVSSYGNVRSLSWSRTGIAKNMYLKKHNRGYLQVELANRDSKKMFLVHRLVAEAFIPNPNGLPLINHINEDKCDNRVENLEWCTQSINMRKYADNHWVGRKRQPYKHTRPIRQMFKNGETVKEWDCVNDIKHKLGYRDSHITDCCNGIRKSAYGFIWQYAN